MRIWRVRDDDFASFTQLIWARREPDRLVDRRESVMETISNKYKLMEKPIQNVIHCTLCWAWFRFVSILAACYLYPSKTSWFVSTDLYDLNKSGYFCAERENLWRLKVKKYNLTSMKRLSSSFLQIFSRSSEIKVVNELSLHHLTQKH